MDAIGKLLSDDVPRLRAAIETVLADVSYRQAASRIAEEMSALPAIDDVVATFGS
jgi:UDP:flavonoid glycosyltransferase YjiC (YdhE family)